MIPVPAAAEKNTKSAADDKGYPAQGQQPNNRLERYKRVATENYRLLPSCIMQIGKRIRKLRLQQSYMQVTFAEVVNLSELFISYSERVSKQVWKQSSIGGLYCQYVLRIYLLLQLPMEQSSDTNFSRVTAVHNFRMVRH